MSVGKLCNEFPELGYRELLVISVLVIVACVIGPILKVIIV